MAKEEISPEEKLLNIIEEEDKKTLKKSGQAGIENPGGAGKPAINIKNLKAWIHKIHSAKKWPFFNEKYPLA
ncbi:MAG: hypothetical protein U9R52_02040, partial [Candidatus Omnitrophota bacterium]|nr:hypothetical protein [Candidatus Omnitrophota bacterium]